MSNQVSILGTSLRRLGLERQQEKTVEAVIQLAPTYESVDAFLKDAGISKPRSAAGIQRSARQAIKVLIAGYDLESVEDMEIWLRADLQGIVDASLEMIISARDEVFQVEQITAQTSIEQRLVDVSFREKRKTAGLMLDQAWFAGQWVTGAWGACTGALEKERKRSTETTRFGARSHATKPFASSGENVVMLTAWKQAQSTGRSE
ncbi:hypothetical protein [Acetobacter sp.]|uniref:hypothetical protein n=1 Tax=Acetobacter sp. TaxID=440 RepID=UPI0039E83C4C